jgi:lipoyl(octanoyl) transferase
MCLTGFDRSLRVERMGRVPYGPMLALQEARHAAVAAGDFDDTLFLLEHEAVITLGKNSGAGHVTAAPSLLANRGIEVFATGRGGDVTYHGPGQIVGYPIVQLQEDERDIKRFVAQLEEVMIRAVHDFGVEARRVEGLRGIWVGDEKIGAVGVRLANWTTMHGFALNVATRLEDFSLIVPCGLHGRGVTSLQKLLGERAPELAAVEERLAFHAGYVMMRRTYDAAATALPASIGTSETRATA